MISELASQEKVIGVKQSRKAIREGRAKRVYLACDADPAITEPVAASCAEAGIPVETDYTLSQLARRAGSAWARPWWPSSPHKEMVFFGIASPRSVKNKGCRGYTAAKL